MLCLQRRNAEINRFPMSELGATLTLLVCAGVCLGQAAQTNENCGPDVAARKAYTAGFRYTSVSLTTDGETNTYTYDGTEAADSQGRTIISTNMPSASGKGIDITGARIFDPVRGTETIWGNDQGEATIWMMPPPEERHGCWQLESSKFRFDLDKLFSQHCEAVAVQPDPAAKAMRTSNPKLSTGAPLATEDAAVRKDAPGPVAQSLGIAMIAGVRAYGVHETWPVDAGAEGVGSSEDARPWVSEEHWIAMEYDNLWVKQVVDYAERPDRTKRWSKELVSFTPGDPDLSAFEPPPDFPVVTRGMYRVPCSHLGAQEP